MRLRRGTVLSIFLKIGITFFKVRPCHPIGEWSKLRLVQVIFNNGDRSSSTDYPNMPDRSQQWPEGPGQLTPTGMLQQCALGAFFRSRYTDYLDKQYTRHQIRVESADVDSRLMSAQCHLAGLYPTISLRLPMQPVPIHALSPEHKHMLEFDEPCRRYDVLLHKATHSKLARTVHKINKEFMTEVTEAAGWSEATLKNMGKTYEALYSAIAHGIGLPKWANQSAYEKLGHLAAEQYRLEAFTPEMRRLRAGTFLNMMMQRMLGKASKVMDPRMKFYIYSSHDSMLAQIISALGVDIDMPLSPAAALIFELEEIRPGDLIVRVLYRNSSTSNTEDAQQLKLLQIPGCSVDCPLKTFHQIVTPMCMIKDWHKECASASHFKGRKIGVTMLIFILVLGISVILYIIHNLRKRRRTMQDEGYVRTFDNYGSATDML